MGYYLKKGTVDIKIVAVIISVLLAGIDQLTKMIVVALLKPIGTVSLIKFGDTEVLNLTYCENTGMSFSMLEGQRVILILLPVLLIGFVEWYIFSGKPTRKDMIIALAALAGGGLGNLIDRVFVGYVVDFIDFRLINFAIFNFADICAVCGGIWFAVTMVIEEIKSDKAKKLAETQQDTQQEQPSEQQPVSSQPEEPDNGRD